jgi:hypothetical protein
VREATTEIPNVLDRYPTSIKFFLKAVLRRVCSFPRNRSRRAIVDVAPVNFSQSGRQHVAVRGFLVWSSYAVRRSSAECQQLEFEADVQLLTTDC